jgi:heavy metal sensor kinase
MNMLNLRHIRVRLAVANLLVFGGILILYALGTSWYFIATLQSQMDGSLKEELEIIEHLVGNASIDSYPPDIHGEHINELERFLEIWSADGHLLYRSKALGKNALGERTNISLVGSSPVIRSQLLADGTYMRVAEKRYDGPPPRVILLAVREAGYFADMYNLMFRTSIAIPVALLLVLVFSYVMARHALQPIDLMASTARRLNADNLTERIPVKNPDDELGKLAATFNELLARVESAFAQLKRFTSDASHELRTPLTAMRSVGEVGLQVSRTPAEYRDVIGSMLEEGNRLTKLVDSLLFLSRADAGKHLVRKETLDLLRFARETAGLFSILAEEKSQSLEITGQPGIIVYADRTLLCQAFLNILDNAIKFSPDKSRIRITVRRTEASRGCIDIADSGPGIPTTEQGRVFERFYRLNTHRERGSGLGLAIARWAVEAHGGSINVTSSDGNGSIFSILLPLAS